MKPSQTLKPTECIARGCSIQSAMISTRFKVAEYAMKEINIYPIKCSWKFFKHGTDELLEDPEKEPTLFTSKSYFPNLKSINFPKDAKIEVKLFYDPVPVGA